MKSEAPSGTVLGDRWPGRQSDRRHRTRLDRVSRRRNLSRNSGVGSQWLIYRVGSSQPAGKIGVDHDASGRQCSQLVEGRRVVFETIDDSTRLAADPRAHLLIEDASFEDLLELVVVFP